MDTSKVDARKKSKPSNATRATKLYRALKLDIIQGALAPREQLRINMLCNRYDTGASPLREALNRLSAEGFVVQHDQRGFAVADIPPEDLHELTFTRCLLNEIMIPAALKNGDEAWEERVVIAHHHLSKTPPFTSDGQVNEEYLSRHREFHMSLLAPCGSRWLLELSEKLFDWALRYQYQALRADIVGSRDVAREHNELVKATLARDVAKSIKLHNEHVRSTSRYATGKRERTPVV
ncbi:GntR family transcriptional regulator [Rhodoplanes sp. Z2-YC6860]|uniref:GntR family transcriptional regulator n=1 Tax=Rhodoplanes sp. Z2-YC6860 TaxID=674703 RepID=UPI0018DBE89D|nr:GntR family transcriptional regulator [Rhodoplanes sp. Z2-YC6860]